MSDNIQLTHTDHRHSDKRFPLSIIADNLANPLNVGSLFRLCDALGIEKLYLCGDTATPPNNKIKKTSRSTENHVDYEIHENAVELVTSLKSKGSHIISLEITNTSVDIGSDVFKSALLDERPICLIVGSENSGVDKALLTRSDLTVHIPMIGNNSSMNVVTAAAIACYEIISTM